MINYRLFLLRCLTLLAPLIHILKIILQKNARLLLQKPALDDFLEAKMTVAKLTINCLDENSVLTLETDASSNAVGVIL